VSGLDGVTLHLVDSMDEVLKLRSWLGERRPQHALGFDTETTGLEFTDTVRLAQIGDGMTGWAIPWDRWGGVFEDVVARWDGLWLAHNMKFDVGKLDNEDVFMPRPRVHDTRIMTQVLDPHYSTALKNVAARLVDAAAANAQALLNTSLTDGSGESGWTWKTVPITYGPYWTYGALDPVLTYRIWEILWPQVDATCREAFEIENAVTWITERMERRGVHINTAFAREKYDAFTAYVTESAQWVKDTYGVTAGSNAAIVQVLQEAGFAFDKATASGAVALDKEVLGAIDHPLAQTILQRRRLQKLASTYLKHFVEEVDAHDLIHPSINVLGARTSRMSMERPNLQNLPRKSNSNPAADAIRECADTRYGETGTMLMCDFDQIEMRGLAYMANEQPMIDAFHSPNDFFVELAKLVYDDDLIVKTDPRRQVVKNAGYATIYGAGVEKFALTAGIDIDTAHRVRRRWNELFPGVAKFQNDVIAVALQRRETEGAPYVRCPLTRRRQVADAGKEYALVNYLIQGWAAAVFKKKLIEADDAGLGEWMCVPVHDEIVLDVPNEHVTEAAHTLVKVMNDDRIAGPVPITASVSYGRTWGSKEAWVEHHGE